MQDPLSANVKQRVVRGPNPRKNKVATGGFNE